MTEIRQEEKTSVRRPWLRPALVAGAVAAVTAVTLTLAAPSGGDAFVPPAAHPSTAVTQLLEDAALAAEHQDVPKVSDAQFTYVKSTSAWGITERTCEVATAGPLQTREVWTSVDGSREGLLRGTGTDVDSLPIHPDPNSEHNYRSWENLPTDPDEMLAWLYEHKSGKGRGDAYYAFKEATGMVAASILPPKASAAIYRAVAKIPGVVLVKNSVDAVGRHGTAVGFVSEEENLRHELIFDTKTWLPLGIRDVALKDYRAKRDVGCDGVIKAGSVEGASAVLERAIVDKKGERP